MKNGCKWRALPERFGNWSAVYDRFRRWSRSGVLERLFAALREQEAVGEDAECFRSGARPPPERIRGPLTGEFYFGAFGEF